ncbi:MAG: multicopper oxidase domain-containing protein [Chitinophagaceae bacterium]|nr:multicopper oxidase domain-containing protein [Chitinophagaceae bacterium]
MKTALILISILLITNEMYAQKKVRYDLYVKDTMVHYTGKHVHAIAINGAIPAPELHFTEGDTAEVYVHNLMPMETSVHWHGLVLPNRYDGVPYLTTAPILAGETKLFTFPLVQSGTYWYHSHTMLQEQSGMYGAFIIHKRNEKPVKEHTMLLSDWTNENPQQVFRSLYAATDWYAIQKKSTQSYTEAIREGHFKTKLANEWKRMLAMDVSDVYYNRFFNNGTTSDSLPDLKAGDKIRLRIVNGSSSTYFWLKYAGGKITVIANDGMDTEPVAVDRLIVGVAETYDVEVTVPQNMRYEFLATSEDRTGSVSLWLGKGMDVKAGALPRLNYFEGMKMMNSMMKMNGQMDDMGMQMSLQQMDMNAVMYPEITGEVKSEKKEGNEVEEHTMDHSSHKTHNETKENKITDHSAHEIHANEDDNNIVTLNYTMLRSPVTTVLPDGPVKELRFNLTGNMNRYVWSIDNKTVSETDMIPIKKGENVRIILYNGTMMRHPMHLHGHFFRVLNGQGDYAPLKNTLDIMPMETDTLEFAASESGDWFFHCHILYHMMSGMGRIFRYEDSPPNPEIDDPVKALRKVYADDRRFHLMGKAGLESNGSDGELTLMNTRWEIQTEWRLGLNKRHGWESETHIGRRIGVMQWLMPYAGFDYRYRKSTHPEKNIFGQANTKNQRGVICAGIQYTLPWLVIADARLDMEGKARIQLAREDIPVSPRLRFNFMLNTDKEYMAGFRYIVTKYFSLSTHYDSDMGWGGGITLTY